MPSSFNTENSSYMPGKVVDVNDPEKRGRVKIRRLDQDESNIPDDKLPWSFIRLQGHSQTGGIGRTPSSNYLVGQWVMSGIMAADGQTSEIIGPINSPGDESSDKHYIPPQAIDKRKRLKQAKEGDGTLNTLKVKVDWESDDIFKYFLDKSNGIPAKFKDKKTIGPQAFDGGNVLDFIKKIDPQNSSGSVQPAVDIMKKLLKDNSFINSTQGVLGNLFGMLNQVLQNKNGGNIDPKPGDPCSIDDKPGTLQYVNNELTCVINNNIRV